MRQLARQEPHQEHAVLARVFSAAANPLCVATYLIVGMLVYKFSQHKPCDAPPPPAPPAGGEALEEALEEGCLQPWSYLDALYFSIVTTTTVGYGDLSPELGSAKWEASTSRAHTSPRLRPRPRIAIVSRPAHRVMRRAGLSPSQALRRAGQETQGKRRRQGMPWLGQRGYRYRGSTDACGVVPVSPVRGQVFTVCYILGALIVAAPALNGAVDQLMTPLFDRCREALDRAFPRKTISLDLEGEEGFTVPRSRVIYYTKGLLAPTVVFAAVQLAFAAAFRASEGLDYGTALYHCLITATTVGYGDVRLDSDASKLLAFFHILVSVSLLAVMLSEFEIMRSERSREMRRAKQLLSSLNVETILSLDTDNRGVDRFEFVVGMLTRLGYVAVDDVQAFVAQFNAMDASGDGILTKAELERYAQLRVASSTATAERAALVKSLCHTVEKDESRRNLWHHPLKSDQCDLALSEALHTTSSDLTVEVGSPRPNPPQRSHARLHAAAAQARHQARGAVSRLQRMSAIRESTGAAPSGSRRKSLPGVSTQAAVAHC